MRASHTPRPSIRHLARVSVMALLAGLLNVMAAAPASASTPPDGYADYIASNSPGYVTVAGWTRDADNPGVSLDVHFYVGSQLFVIAANQYRPDPTLQCYCGFAATVPINPGGTFAWSATGMDSQDSQNTRLIDVTGTNATITVADPPPNTTITSAPRTATPTDVIRVAFTASEPNTTFQCHWDEAPWADCVSSTSTSLPPGNHMIFVRATDAYGNVEADPATWVVAVSEIGTQPPLPPPGRTVAAGAAKKKSKLRVDVDPDSAEHNYVVVIQRPVAKKWRTVSRVHTRGSRDVVVVDLRRGKYRAVLPKSASGPAVVSDTVRLRR